MTLRYNNELLEDIEASLTTGISTILTDVLFSTSQSDLLGITSNQLAPALEYQMRAFYRFRFVLDHERQFFLNQVKEK